MLSESSCDSICRAQILSLPEVTNGCGMVPKSKVRPPQLNILNLLADIKHCQILLIRLRTIRHPYPNVAFFEHLVSSMTVLIHLEHLFVRDQSGRS
jgi:hypothetical protein